RRRQGHRGADAQAVRGLPPARHPDHDLHQQDGPRGARSARAARRDRRPAAARMRAHGVAGRHGIEFPRHDRSLHGGILALRRRRQARRQRGRGAAQPRGEGQARRGGRARPRRTAALRPWHLSRGPPDAGVLWLGAEEFRRARPALRAGEERAAARPRDIIGIPNHGVLRVGDTLSESGEVVFTGIPNFAPEILRRVRLSDPIKQKHLTRALESLAEEGVTQVFRPQIGSSWIVGVVGPLQLDVLKSRLVAEYGLDADLEPAPYETARWLSGADAEMEKFAASNRGG